MAFGPSPVARDRAATHPENSASASANSRYPRARGSSAGDRTASSPLGVPLHLRRVGHAQLPGHELQHLAGHVQRVLRERPEPLHRGQLQCEAGPHVLPTMPPDQLQVIVFQEEHAIKVTLRRRPSIPAVRRRLVIRQELNRRKPHRKAADATSSPAGADPHLAGVVGLSLSGGIP
jgi:hypothetical protein